MYSGAKPWTLLATCWTRCMLWYMDPTSLLIFCKRSKSNCTFLWPHLTTERLFVDWVVGYVPAGLLLTASLQHHPGRPYYYELKWNREEDGKTTRGYIHRYYIAASFCGRILLGIIIEIEQVSRSSEDIRRPRHFRSVNEKKAGTPRAAALHLVRCRPAHGVNENHACTCISRPHLVYLCFISPSSLDPTIGRRSIHADHGPIDRSFQQRA
jgi:hypothetical protein